MATKLYMTDVDETAITANPCTVGSPARDTRVLSLTPGSSLQVEDAATIGSGAWCSTSGLWIDSGLGAIFIWVSNPLNAVTISSTITINLWMSENSMSANVGAAVSIMKLNNDGSLAAAIVGCQCLSGGGCVNTCAKGTELPLNTRQAQNWTSAASNGTLTDGQRIAVVVGGSGVGGMAGGFTYNFGFNGATGGADGDSWVQFTETITEFTPPPDTIGPSPIMIPSAATQRRVHRSRMT